MIWCPYFTDLINIINIAYVKDKYLVFGSHIHLGHVHFHLDYLWEEFIFEYWFWWFKIVDRQFPLFLTFLLQLLFIGILKFGYSSILHIWTLLNDDWLFTRTLQPIWRALPLAIICASCDNGNYIFLKL